MNENYDYKRLTPFKWFVLQNFPFIDEDFDAITNYQLFCKLGEEINKLIESMNLTGQQVEELTNAFNNLKDYVDNYFDNLDVQKEVNTKLDAMVEDGTLAKIINQEIFSDLNNQLSTNTQNIRTLQTTVGTHGTQIESVTNEVNDLKLNKLRKKLYNNYHLFNYPIALNSFFNNIKIFESNDKKNYKHNMTKEKLMLNTSNTFYISKDGDDKNDGTSWATAWKTLTRLVNQVADNSTVYVGEGIYYRPDIPSTGMGYNIFKNLNIIGVGKVILTMADNLEYTQNPTYPNVYQAVRSGVFKVIDIRGKENNVYSEMTKVGSLADCSVTINSYYEDGTNVYINNGEIVNSNNTLVELASSNSVLGIQPNTTDNEVYMENITILGGNAPCLFIKNNGGNNTVPYVKCYNCKFLYGGSINNVVDVAGSKAIFMDCEASFGNKDGFNYYLSNNKPSYALEINCKASNNGLTSDNSNNGSTAHGGSQVIRMNGSYYNNKGVNVGDIHDNTISLNFNCNAFDSYSTEETHKADFGALGSLCKMYLYNCFAKGNSNYNIISFGDSILYKSNCEYNTTGGNGTIINI